MLMLHETRSVARKVKSDTREEDEENVALLVVSIGCEPTYKTVARQVVLKAMCETPVLVCTQAAALTKVDPYEDGAKDMLS